jgi:hypothetical protein
LCASSQMRWDEKQKKKRKGKERRGEEEVAVVAH